MGKITCFSENQMLLKILLSINSVRKDNLKKHIWIWKVDSLLQITKRKCASLEVTSKVAEYIQLLCYFIPGDRLEN